METNVLRLVGLAFVPLAVRLHVVFKVLNLVLQPVDGIVALPELGIACLLEGCVLGLLLGHGILMLPLQLCQVGSSF